MDIQALLQPFFASAAMFLGGPGLVAATIAQIVFAALNQAGFDPVEAAKQLGKLGFKISQTLLPELIEAAKAGVKSLTKWLETEMASSVEVNEAAASVLIEQAEPIAKAVQEGTPAEKENIAEEMQKGLQAYGGAMVEIAEAYKAVIKDLSQLHKLIQEMRHKLDVWANQKVEAKRGSLVKNVRQVIEGSLGGKQEVYASDQSTIEDVQQRISGSSTSD